MNYERLIQWLAGPFAVLIGYVATKIVHANISHSAAVNTATFILGTLAVLAPHIKWLNNLPKWWQESGIAAPAGLLTTGDESNNPPSTAYLNAKPDQVDMEMDKDERTNTSTENAVKSDDESAETVITPPVTGVTGVTDLGESAPVNPDSSDLEKLRAQIRNAGLKPEA